MRRRFAGVLLGLPLALGLALAGCGGSDDDAGGVATAGGAAAEPSASAPGPAGLSEDERQVKFAQCMRENGMEMPDPEAGDKGTVLRFGEGDDPQKVEAAMEKCRMYLPGGGEPPKLDAAQIEKMRELAKCMRANGVPDFPDPEPDGKVVIKPGTTRMDPQDGRVKAAMEKCREYAPDFGSHQ